MDNKNYSKTTLPIYKCKLCDYSTAINSNYHKHLSTRKHKRITMDNKNYSKTTLTEDIPVFTNFICDCGKKYRYASGLSKHKKTCKLINLENNENVENIIIRNNKQMTVPVEMWEKVMNHMDKQQEVLLNLSSKTGKTINNNFNIQIFLNETCKNALSMTDFVNSLQLRIEDLMYSKKNGTIDGISNILVKGLKELEVEKRPLHCTDIKRETLYIKDDNGWEKDNKDKDKLKKAIKVTQQRHARLISDWQLANPNWMEDDNLMDEFHELIHNICLEDGAENKVIKNLVKEVQVDKDI